VGVVGVGGASPGDGVAREAVGAGGVAVGPRPGVGAASGAVEELEEVADVVVGVGLEVATDGAGVGGQGEVADRLVIMVELGGADGGVLAAGGFDQSINGVVGVEVFGRNEGVVVEEALLGVVLDADDVADGVEFVAQVLEGVARGHSGRDEALQAEGKLVVVVLGGEGGGALVVAVFDPRPLAFGVVVEVFDDWRRGGGAAQVDAEGLEEAGLVVEGLEEGVVGGGDGGNPVEGVKGAELFERFGLDRGSHRDLGGVDVVLAGDGAPVGRAGVGGRQLAPGGEQVGLEVVRAQLEQAGAVVQGDELAAEVVVLGVGEAGGVAVVAALEQGLAGAADLEEQVGGAAEVVVLGAEALVSRVPAAAGFAEDGGQVVANAAVDVVAAQEAAGDGVGVGLAEALEGVRDAEGVAFEVELGAGGEVLGRGAVEVVGDAEDGAAEGVEVLGAGGGGVGAGFVVGDAPGVRGGEGLAGLSPEVFFVVEGVVAVPGLGLPGPLGGLFVGSVGVVDSDESAGGVVDDAPTRRCSGRCPCAPDELPPIRPRRYRACGRMGELWVGAALAALGGGLAPPAMALLGGGTCRGLRHRSRQTEGRHDRNGRGAHRARKRPAPGADRGAKSEGVALSPSPDPVAGLRLGGARGAPRSVTGGEIDRGARSTAPRGPSERATPPAPRDAEARPGGRAREVVMRTPHAVIVARAVAFRAAPTTTEALLWEALRADKLGVRFRRQVVLGRVHR
jgi:hypothetical protein